MFSFSNTYVTIFRAILALAGWTALGLQLHIVLDNASRDGTTALMAVGNFLSYFTILTNAAIALGLSISVLAPRSMASRWFETPSVQTSLTGCIIIVSLIYHAALAKAWNPQGLQWWTNFFLHDAIPVAWVLHWLLFVPKGNLNMRQPLLWLVYPLLYLIWMMGRGRFTGFYPYPFVDVAWHGYTRVMENLVILTVGFVVLFYLLVLVDRWMGKYFDGFFLRK
jgi:hypothetical protein